jgi:diaminopimelate decarboxylase
MQTTAPTTFPTTLTEFAGHSVASLAARFGTPLYMYDAAVIQQRVAELADFDAVRYAQKACSNLAVLDLVRRLGVVVDAVSAGEVARALAAGYRPSPKDHDPAALVAGHHPAIVYTADVFDRESLAVVVEHDLPVNCGSPDMIDQYGERCRALGRVRGVTLRVNPGFGHGHSQKTNTGGEGSKHGVWHGDVADCVRSAARWGLTVSAIHMHIGSGTDLEHLSEVCGALQRVALEVGPTVRTISAGGGLPTPYRGDEPAVDLGGYYRLWNGVRERLVAAWGQPVGLELEPGRYLVAESGALITEVRAVKQMGSTRYVLVDAGFNNLARPAMYGAYHPIALCPTTAGDRPVENVVVGGPLCESGDIFTQLEGGYVDRRALPAARVGDYLVIGCAGAYGYTMASNYNSKPLVAEVLVQNGEAHLVRERQTVEDLLRGERIPQQRPGLRTPFQNPEARS